MEFDLENPVSNYDFLTLFTSESDHMPCFPSISNDEHHQLALLRSQAVSLFLQKYPHLDHIIVYLAINYFDRFIYKEEMPVRSELRKPWLPKLLVLTCISLAAKIRNADIEISALQCDGDFVFDEQSIRRMEVVILGSLNWRVRSITPFSFLNFFIGLFELIDPSVSRALKSRASQILFESQYESKILEYKPSVIAASAIISASYELFPEQSIGFRSAISFSGYIDNVSLFNSSNILQDMVMNQNRESDSVKRRKLNGLTYDRRLQPPQIQHCSSLRYFTNDSHLLEK